MKKDNVIPFPKEKRYPVTSENAIFSVQSSNLTLTNELSELDNFEINVDTEHTVMITFDLK